VAVVTTYALQINPGDWGFAALQTLLPELRQMLPGQRMLAGLRAC